MSLWDDYSNNFSPWGVYNQFMGKNDIDPTKQASQDMHEGYDPYIKQGQQMDPELIKQYMSLMKDPSSVMNNIGSGFKASPGYQFQLDQAMNASNNAAAAGGYLGNADNQYSSQQTAQGLASQDFYNYLKNAMGLYSQGLSGGQHISDRGANASMGLADKLAAMHYAGALNKNQANSDRWSNMFGMAEKVAPYFLM